MSKPFAIALTVMLVLVQYPPAEAGQAAAGGRQGQAGPLGRGGGAAGRLGGRGRGAQQATGTAVISGRVMAADTRTPVRGAQVRLTSAASRTNRVVSTDADGRYEARNLPAGRWVVSAMKGGFVALQHGQRRAFEVPEPIELDEGERFTADFTLPRGSVITGRVFDEYGDPVTGARVQAMRSQMAQGQRRLTAVGTPSQTDDTGAFRLFGLAPGDYYVAAALRGAMADAPDDNVTHVPIYFPGTPSVGEAQRLVVGPGEEQANVNFTLLPVRAVRVSGTVVDSSGMPLPAAVMLSSNSPLQTGGPAADGGRGVADGQFTIANVPPGSYTMIVAGRRGGSGDPERAAMPLTVGNDDISGLTIVTGRGSTVRGTIVTEGGARLPAGLRMVAQPLRPAGPLAVQPGPVAATGAFELRGLLGPHTLALEGLPPNWMIKTVRANGTVVATSAMDFRNNDEVDVEIALTDRVTAVNGTARLRDQPAAGATIVVFAEDAAKWTPRTRFVRSARANAQGVFTVRGLPSDERYLAVGVDYVEQGEAEDPEFLERMRAKATAFRLDAEQKTIDLTLTER